MKTHILIIFLVLLTTTSCSNKQKKKGKDSFRVEIKLTGTEKTNNMTVLLRTSRGCYINDDLKKTSTKGLDEPEKITVEIKGDTACFSTNGKYVFISASCGSSTFDGAMMCVKVYRKNRLSRQLITTRIRPINTLEYRSLEDELF